jgi:diaminopimelate decarboxylase
MTERQETREDREQTDQRDDAPRAARDADPPRAAREREVSDQSDPSDGGYREGEPAVRRLEDWDADALCALGERYGSPLYVLDLDRVRANYRRLASAFTDASVQYAAKANAHWAVLRTLDEAGAGVECASAGEVVRALDADVGIEALHYTAVNPPAHDLETVLELWRTRASVESRPLDVDQGSSRADPDGGAASASSAGFTVSAGARDTVDRLAERGYDGRLCVRVNPGVGAGHHEKVRTGGDATFGVPLERARDVAEHADATGMDVVGVQAHAGSGILENSDVEAYVSMLEAVADVARELGDVVDIEFVDVGGGFGVPYHASDSPLDVDGLARAIESVLASVDATVVVEPGRYLVADAGVLLTDVNTVKETTSTVVVGVDAGMTTLARPALYDAHHELRNCSATDERRARVGATVTGPVCESADVFARNRPLARPERGDVLAIGTAGAYGYEMASTYTSRPRPASVVLEDGDATLARRREPLHSLTALEQ